MEKIFPSLGQYEQYFRKEGSSCFQSLKGIVLKASRLTPIKLFLFGSGAYAAVFKGILEGKTYAIRCFLTIDSDTISRYKKVGQHLNSIQSNWKVNFQFLDNELLINNNLYPILKMEWIEGKLLNEFISNNLQIYSVIEEIQKQLIAISRNLEEKEVGHGDLQFGNIMVSGTSNSFTLKLIDYDGMYVPELEGKKAIELGRSEFQHPKRNAYYFNPQMDRFSFWVMSTGLEAIKHDKTLWQPVMQGGYNTLDNCLFTAQDFSNPHQSALFQKLHQINNNNLNFYLEKLKGFCLSDIKSVEAPRLAGEMTINEHYNSSDEIQNTPLPKENRIKDPSNFRIECLSGAASVLSSTFEKIGETPLVLNKEIYEGKTIIVSDGKEINQIKLTKNQAVYEISFLNRSKTSLPLVDVRAYVPKEEVNSREESEILAQQIEDLERKKLERKRLEEENERIKKRIEREEIKKLNEKRERTAELNRLEKEDQKKKEKENEEIGLLFLLF